MANESARKPNPNALLLFWRQTHGWIGLIAGLFLITTAVTGIYLNHKNTLGEVLGLKKPEREREPEAKSHAGAGMIGMSASELAALPVSFAGALSTASGLVGDSQISRVELKAEKGRWVYKVKGMTGWEAIIDAATGHAEITGDTKLTRSKPQFPETPSRNTPREEPKPFDWSKAIKDLHTGKIAGDAGKLLVDLAAVAIILLTLSGLYLWLVPKLRKSRSARQRKMATATAACSPPASGP